MILPCCHIFTVRKTCRFLFSSVVLEQWTASYYKSWCKCGKCKIRYTEQEHVCCNRQNYITLYRHYSIAWTMVAIHQRSNIHAEDISYSPKSFWKAAFWQYILWMLSFISTNYHNFDFLYSVLLLFSIYMLFTDWQQSYFSWNSSLHLLEVVLLDKVANIFSGWVPCLETEFRKLA